MTFQGYKRADAWKEVFKNVKFDAVYATNYNRTKLTAKPTADANQLPIRVYDPKNMYTESFQYNTKGKTILVVGHSNTTPMFVNKILGVKNTPRSMMQITLTCILSPLPMEKPRLNYCTSSNFT